MSLKISEIRSARPGDADGVARVHAASWRYAYSGIIDGTHLEKMINRRGSVWWDGVVRRRGGMLVTEFDGKIIAYATFGPSRLKDLPYTSEIYELYLLPEYHGLGFGRALFDAARAKLAGSGFRSLAVRALADNVLATGFYSAIGGTEVHRSAEMVGQSCLPAVVFGWGKGAR